MTITNVEVPKKKSKIWLWISLGVVGAFIAGCLGLVGLFGAGATAVQIDTVNKMDDVKITSCRVDEYGIITVKADVTNNSSSTESYWLQYDISSGSVKIGEAYDTFQLTSGQAGKSDAGGFASDDLTKNISCKLISA